MAKIWQNFWLLVVAGEVVRSGVSQHQCSLNPSVIKVPKQRAYGGPAGPSKAKEGRPALHDPRRRLQPRCESASQRDGGEDRRRFTDDPNGQPLSMTPRKPKRYKLCHGARPDDLNFQVSAVMSERWELYGEPFMAAFPTAEENGTAAVYCEAVVHARNILLNNYCRWLRTS
jgi:hypothetical protein